MNNLIYSDVIIIGGGPAGATCAYELKKAGIDCIILEKESFPRTKLCAGWITPGVLKKLGIDKSSYPKGILHFEKMHVQVFGIKKTIKTDQYSIRRKEFDDFLLKRSKVKVYNYEVRSIKKEKGFYIIDDTHKCKYLVGAGGTFCPVYRAFFKGINPRAKESMITALEQEFEYKEREKDCYLWFFKNSLRGYAWYVPKADGYLNIGIGGKFDNANDKDIKKQWDYFVSLLKKRNLIKNHELKPKGYVYHLRDKVANCRVENAFIIGDAAGLATVDLGEGIEPSIESGMICAESIITGKKFSLEKVKRRSFATKEYIKMMIK